jgi:hypothetical protein
MPSPLAVDKEQVRATYLATGCLTETAKAHGIKPATIRQWARREVWPTATNALKAIEKGKAIMATKREHGHKDAVTSCNTSDVLADHIENNKKAFVTNMASGLNKASRAISEMDDLSTLENSRRIVDLATAGKTIFQLGGDEQGARLQLNVLQLSAEAFMTSPPNVGVRLT